MSELPLVCLNHSMANRLAENHPGRVALMFGPSRMRPVNGLPVCLDNDRFSVWARGTQWDEAAFLEMVERVTSEVQPRWIVVPDVVGDADGTFLDWDRWEKRLRGMGCETLALAVQDGMTPESVRRNAEPDVIFVGGTTGWKRRTVWQWCRAFPRVHVGRVNTEKWLWNVHSCGAESSDGTGWFRGDKKQLRGLLRYLLRTDAGMGKAQIEFEFANSA